MQNRKKGLVVAARNFTCRLNRIKVATCQLIMNMPIAIPTKAKLIGFTFPKYSGARYNESAPKVFMNTPSTVLKRMIQNKSNTWYFLKCRNSNCMGRE
jgi:hypothetical protein